MALTYLQMASELRGWVPQLDFPLAQTFVNRAWSDIRGSRLWSFLVAEDALTSALLVSTGTASVTQYSKAVVGSAAAKTAWDAIETAYVPIISRQFRLSGGGPVYNIASYANSTGTITLDRVFQEATNATATYQLYRCYYPAPSSDFLKFLSVLDPFYGFQLGRNWSKQQIDRWDPQRTSQGQPYRLAFYENKADGTPIFEMWPHPTTGAGYPIIYRKRGTDLSADGDVLFPQIPDDLVMSRARYRAYEWAETNKGVHQNLKETNWLGLMAEVDHGKGHNGNSYQALLRDAKRNDDEVFLTSLIVRQRRRWGFPVDAGFMQSHDVGRMLGGF